MNRELKFRVFNKKTNQWVHGPGEEVDLFGEMILCGGFLRKTPVSDINHCIALQYTGIKDKNLKEIYEGDIVHKHIIPNNSGYTNLPYEVKWNKQHCGFGITNGSRHVYEVIGNIFENPKLLSQQPLG